MKKSDKRVDKAMKNAMNNIRKRLLHWLKNGHLVKKIKLISFRKSGIRKLNIGCGPHSVERWINGDIVGGDVYMNASKPLPFPSESIDYIFTEMFSEELKPSEFYVFLCECNRVLRKGGVLRQSIPMLDKIIDLYFDKSKIVSSTRVLARHYKKYDEGVPIRMTNCLWVNSMFHRWGEYYYYDKETLFEMYKTSGFERLHLCGFGVSDHPELANMERHTGVDWMENAFVNIYEAVK